MPTPREISFARDAVTVEDRRHRCRRRCARSRLARARGPRSSRPKPAPRPAARAANRPGAPAWSSPSRKSAPSFLSVRGKTSQVGSAVENCRGSEKLDRRAPPRRRQGRTAAPPRGRALWPRPDASARSRPGDANRASSQRASNRRAKLTVPDHLQELAKTCEERCFRPEKRLLREIDSVA